MLPQGCLLKQTAADGNEARSRSHRTRRNPWRCNSGASQRLHARAARAKTMATAIRRAPTEAPRATLNLQMSMQAVQSQRRRAVMRRRNPVRNVRTAGSASKPASTQRRWAASAERSHVDRIYLQRCEWRGVAPLVRGRALRDRDSRICWAIIEPKRPSVERCSGLVGGARRSFALQSCR